MLTKLVLKNINSIKECVINFKKGSYKFLNDNVLNEIVNPIAIYGHNGSGKTSVLRGVGQLIDLLTGAPNNLIPFIVNDFNLRNAIYKNKNPINLLPESIGTIIVEFTLKDKDFKYTLSTTSRGYVCDESLFVKKERVFHNSNKHGYSYRKESGHKSSFIPSLIPMLRQLASIKIQDSDIQDAYNYLSSFTFVDLPSQKNYGSGFVHSKIFSNTTLLELLEKYSDEVKKYLPEYEDYPIYSIKKNSGNLAFGNEQNKYVLVLEDNDFKEEININFISSGMLNNSMLLSLVLATPDNGVLFIDEIEQALHPTAIEAFLNIVRKKKIQLLFTSHNTHLLQKLRPDQVYFAKWRKGYSTYYRLSDIYPNIREVNNIEKMYLSNIFERIINEQ